MGLEFWPASFTIFFYMYCIMAKTWKKWIQMKENYLLIHSKICLRGRYCVQNGAGDIVGYKDNENPTPMERAYCNSTYKIQDDPVYVFIYTLNLSHYLSQVATQCKFVERKNEWMTQAHKGCIEKAKNFICII